MGKNQNDHRIIIDHLSMNQNYNHTLWVLINTFIWNVRFLEFRAPPVVMAGIFADPKDPGYLYTAWNINEKKLGFCY